MKQQSFHIGDILSVTTDLLLSKNGIDGVRKILDFLTNDEIFTHQLKKTMESCREPLFRQIPQLRKIDINELSTQIKNNPKEKQKEIVFNWVDEQAKKYGEMFMISPIKDYIGTDPLADLIHMTGGNECNIIVVKQ